MTFLVALSDIYVEPALNVSRGGRPITPESVSALAEDIEANGQSEAIGVTSEPEWLDEIPEGKKFVAVYGFRRIAAGHRLGLDEMVARDLGPIDRAQAEMANVAENWSREPPNDYDLTIACHRFIRTLKLDAKSVSRRINRPVSFVEECAAIVDRVRPDLLEHYKVTCTREMRRRMRALSQIEGTPRERFERQAEWWRDQERAQTEQINQDPLGRSRPFKRQGKGGKPASATASRQDHVQAAERLLLSREVYDGHQWVPLDDRTRSILRLWIRWSLDASSELPVR